MDPAPPGTAPSLKILTLTSLFPSTARPRHGIFVETRLQNLVRDCAVDARVVAPVPWFPMRSQVFGEYARYAATPQQATRSNGLRVWHPRYLMLPKVGMGFQPDSMARAALRAVSDLREAGWQPDLIDAHYFYPDGVAAAMVAERLQIPFVVTVRGTDVNVIARMPGPARRIMWASRRASAIVAVSTRLKDALVELGVEADKVIVLRNGVDLELFRPEEQSVARRRLGLPAGRLAACVGNLVPEKGQALAIEMLRDLDNWRLAIVGDGPLSHELRSLARVCGVEQRVVFLPTMPQSELRYLYSSADAMLLTSTREGWPNVVLESLACGTPVVATDVGAVHEMLTQRWVGRIVATRDPRALSAAVAELLAQPVDRDRIRLHAAGFDWASVSRGQLDLFSRALAGHGSPAAIVG